MCTSLDPNIAICLKKLFGSQTNNRAEAMACLRFLQHVHRSGDLHVHTDSKWSCDIILQIRQYHDKQWRSTRQKLMHCDIWAMVYDVLQQRTGQTLWSHQYGHNQCPFNDKADALAKQAAATHPLRLGPCVLKLRPGVLHRVVGVLRRVVGPLHRVVGVTNRVVEVSTGWYGYSTGW